MDNKLVNKKYESYDYISRYTSVPYYYDRVNGRDVYGIGSNLKLNTAWVAHKVKPEDTLDTLALEYYNDPSLWWIIANYNKILDPFIKLNNYFKILKIPSMSSIAFGADNE